MNKEEGEKWRSRNGGGGEMEERSGGEKWREMTTAIPG